MGRKAAVFAVALCAFWSLTARSGALETYGASSRGTSMGGAMVSIADSWDSVVYNASSLGLARNSTSVQISYLQGELIKNNEDQLSDGPMFKFGVNHRFLRNRIGVGLLVGFNSASTGSGVSLDLGSITGGGGGGWEQYAPDPLVLSFGIGFRVTDWLGVGVDFNQRDTLISTGYFPLVVDPLLQSLIGIDTGAIPSNVEGMSFDAGTDPSDDFETAFSVTLRPLPYISFGYVYKPESWIRIKGRVELVGGQGSLLPESQYILLDMKMPSQVETTVIGGAGHIPIPWNDGWLTLAYTHEQQNWDGFYSRSTQFQWDAEDIFTEEWFIEKLTRDPGLDDIAFDRYGFEYEGDATPLMFWKLRRLQNPRFAVRGGYYHWESPQPRPRYEYQLSMLDADADIYSFGLGFGFDRRKARASIEDPLASSRIQVDLHYQMIVIEDRDFRFQEDEWGSKPIENYIQNTEGNLTNIGIQISWLH